MGDTLTIAKLLVSVAESANAIKALTLWQKLTLAFYTLAAGASTYGVSHDWKYAVATALGAFVAHVHGQLQPAPAQALPSPQQPVVIQQYAAAQADKVIASTPSVHQGAGIKADESELLSSTKF